MYGKFHAKYQIYDFRSERSQPLVLIKPLNCQQHSSFTRFRTSFVHLHTSRAPQEKTQSSWFVRRLTDKFTTKRPTYTSALTNLQEQIICMGSFMLNIKFLILGQNDHNSYFLSNLSIANSLAPSYDSVQHLFISIPPEHHRKRHSPAYNWSVDRLITKLHRLVQEECQES